MPTYLKWIVATCSLAEILSLAESNTESFYYEAQKTCIKQYGSEHLFCRVTSSECTYTVTLDGDSCNDFCESHGGVCLYAQADVSGTCETKYENSCDGSRGVNTCTCSREYDPTSAPTSPPTISPTQKPTATPTASPTITPTTRPTLSPTPTPTHSPTMIPTKSPTGRPTAAPTSPPTISPTQKPTATPTASPTHTPTPAPTLKTSSPTPEIIADDDIVCSKCVRKGCFTSVTPENGIKCDKFSCSTMTHCPGYKLVSAQTPGTANKKTSTTVTAQATDDGAATAAPADLQPDEFPEPPTNPPSTLETGMVCSTERECISGVCRNGACMASAACYPVKHVYGTPFHVNKVNLVFVASAFNSDEQWRNQVNQTYNIFKQYRMFDESIAQLNVFYVNPSVLHPSFCAFNCAGIPRLLCCKQPLALSLSSKCFPEGANLQTIVIHNDDRYGGAGYADHNMATMSTHPEGALVAVHELGHSLFELTDEYPYGPGTDNDPNCAFSEDCSKWADLIGNTPQGYSKVKCKPGCRNGNYFVGESSYMDVLSNPVGAVNTRYSCCTYQALTKSFPQYCDPFDFEPGYLLNFCIFNDFQNYGRTTYDADPKQQIVVGAQDENSKFVYVTDPLLLSVKLRRGSKRGAVVVGQPRAGQTGLYRRNQVHGDYKKVAAAFKDGVDSVVRVKVIYANGFKNLFFNRNITIDIPSSPIGEGSAYDEEPEQRVSEKVNMLNIVLDSRDGTFRRATARLLTREEDR